MFGAQSGQLLTMQAVTQVSSQLQALGLSPLSSHQGEVDGVNFYVSILGTNARPVGKQDIKLAFSGPKGQYEKTATYDGRAAWDYYSYDSQGAGDYTVRLNPAKAQADARATVDLNQRLPVPESPSVSIFTDAAHVSTQAVMGGKAYFAAILDAQGNFLKEGASTSEHFAPTLFISSSDGIDFKHLENYYLLQVAYGWPADADPTQALTNASAQMNSSLLITPLLKADYTSLSAPSLLFGPSKSNTLIQFQNRGQLDLTYSATSDASWLRVTTAASGTLKPWDKTNIGVNASCPAPGQVYHGHVTVRTNDPFEPQATYKVTLDCTASPTLTENWTSQNLGYSNYHQNAVISYASDGSRAVLAPEAYDCRYNVVNTANGSVVGSQQLSMRNCGQLSWRPQYQQLVVSSAYGSDLTLLDVTSGTTLRTFSTPTSSYGTEQVTAVALSTDGSRLAAASGPTLTVWNIDDGAYLFSRTLSTGSREIRSMSFSPDGTKLALGYEVYSSSFSHSMDIIDVGSGEVQPKLGAHAEVPGLVSSAPQFAWGPDGTQLAVAFTTDYPYNNGWLGVWRTDSFEQLWLQDGLTMSKDLGWSTDGRFLAARQDINGDSPAKKAVVFWSATSGAQMLRYGPQTRDQSSVTGFRWAPQDSSILVAFETGIFRRLTLKP
ncbi:WD40 repeat domain-containing protein [Deinococcus peraridilitoris]|uniref:WD40 repeat-containing protein n=1 Tax=Deinococcus peraridilitoris (strain DSM 19664 / LMG 22246 / CIP 109416 / KR-200) TaxID=937777 RepID=L0A3F4_DEIPD|nr:WD40 repeat domain-containing protein [Deinococcus peraridilitoris]AFZ68428.1 WD40 repeat-containing protein [Deinococcus peraridilitoris DSM 19664]